MVKVQKLTVLMMLGIFMLTSACVSKKKYESATKGKTAAEAKSRKISGQLASANARVSELEKQVTMLEKDLAALEARMKDCEEDRKKLKSDLSTMRSKGSNIYKELKNLKVTSSSERERLDAALKKKSEELDAREKSISELLDKLESREKKLAELQSELDARERKMSDLQDQIAAREKASNELKSELDEREKRIQELQSRIDARDKAMNDLRNNLLNALKGYEEDDLTVEMRNGKVYIAISEKMLFKSASANVEQAGKDALSKVATVLNKYPDMDLIIEGHTDSLPIKTAQFADNWDLSVIRATSVVRILTVDYGMSSERVMPAGRGEFFPKATNKTPEGRAKNRRTEIIIAPKLDAIEEMLKK